MRRGGWRGRSLGHFTVHTMVLRRHSPRPWPLLGWGNIITAVQVHSPPPRLCAVELETKVREINFHSARRRTLLADMKLERWGKNCKQRAASRIYANQIACTLILNMILSRLPNFMSTYCFLADHRFQLYCAGGVHIRRAFRNSK